MTYYLYFLCYDRIPRYVFEIINLLQSYGGAGLLIPVHLKAIKESFKCRQHVEVRAVLSNMVFNVMVYDVHSIVLHSLHLHNFLLRCR